MFIYYGGTLLSTDGVMDFILNQRFDNNDAASSSRVYRYEISADLVSVEDRKTESPPRDFMLQQSYPNPFNPTTVISYTVPTAAHVKLEIFNIKGEIIQALVDEFKSRGSYSARFDASKFTSGFVFLPADHRSFSANPQNDPGPIDRLFADIHPLLHRGIPLLRSRDSSVQSLLLHFP